MIIHPTGLFLKSKHMLLFMHMLVTYILYSSQAIRQAIEIGELQFHLYLVNWDLASWVRMVGVEQDKDKWTDKVTLVLIVECHLKFVSPKICVTDYLTNMSSRNTTSALLTLYSCIIQSKYVFLQVSSVGKHSIISVLVRWWVKWISLLRKLPKLSITT